MSELLRTVEMELAQPATHAVIWLHGLGANGHDFEPIVPELGLGQRPIRFVFPHAPSIPVTLNGGFVMPAWYDIEETDLQRRHDEAGVRRSAEQVEALIERQHERGVPSRNIVLAGFSQGGAIALFQGLRHSQRLAGILALSTYLVVEEKLASERDAVQNDVPIFQAHGSLDPMVPFERGRAAHDRLVQWGYEVEFHDYPMGHQVCLEEVEEIGRWFRGLWGDQE